MNKTFNQKAWYFVIPVFVLVAFNAAVPLMTVVNYSFQETFGSNVFAWEGTRCLQRAGPDRSAPQGRGRG